MNEGMEQLSLSCIEENSVDEFSAREKLRTRIFLVLNDSDVPINEDDICGLSDFVLNRLVAAEPE